MDVLSDAIAVMRTGRPHSSRTRLCAPWGIRFQPQEGAGFHVILQGSCWLIPARGEPVALNVGDVVFLPRELGHGIADTPSRRLADVRLTYDDLPLGGEGLYLGADADDGSGTRTAGDGPGVRTAGDGSGVRTAGGGSGVRTAGGGSGVWGGRDGSGVRTEMLCGAYRLDHSRAHPLLTELPDVVHLPARVGRHPALRAAIDLLGHELGARPRPGGDAALSGLLDLLLLYILRAYYEDQPDEVTAGWGAALRDPAVAGALRAVHEDPARPWTVESLAAQAGLSRAAFARRFTAMVGSPPLGYLTWWRMTIAARLLRDTDLPLRSVAERTGYTSEFAFARAFKREFTTAPGRYRAGSPAAQSSLTG
ncbi:AraC family transcriptional regulator [Actinoallomurus sp. CA-150999]|uniref:AraC family transcriptional regulator n=1 Tax=Actinoallomurus sp. CA-150999 TaxID=3239887 RepID=UPI003D935095